MARTLNTDTAGSASPKPGHNMPPELIQQYFSELVKLDNDLAAANEELKSARGALASKYKLFKENGGTIKVMKRLIRERNQDRTEIALEKQTEEHYRETLNMVIQFGDLVTAAEHSTKIAHATSSDDKRHAALDKIEDEGFFAGRDGETRDSNPHALESDEWHQWNTGWDKYAMESLSGGKKAKGGGGRKAKGANGAAATH